jgi:anti-sigma regulatory factor (Ser/Thr protein kinase)
MVWPGLQGAGGKDTDESRPVVAEPAQGRVSGFRHAGLLYASSGEFAAGVAGFVERAVRASAPVLVACPGPGLDVLRPRLDGHGALVTWADMASIGLNPARLIDLIQLFAGRHRGRVTWCVHEPAWPGRSPQELREVIRHEALVNLALADMPVSVLCPYDVRRGTGLIAGVERTHPALAGAGRRWPSSSYAAGMVPRECDLPLSTPPAASQALRYRADLAGVRAFAASRARRAGLAADRVGDLMAAVGELAANTFVHTSGPGTVTVWATRGEIICQVNDTGQITDPLAGRLRRDPAAAGGGHGLWVVQQACDLVQIRTSPAGTAIRLHMHLNPD